MDNPYRIINNREVFNDKLDIRIRIQGRNDLIYKEGNKIVKIFIESSIQKMNFFKKKYIAVVCLKEDYFWEETNMKLTKEEKEKISKEISIALEKLNVEYVID